VTVGKVKVGNAQYIGARGEQQDYFGITDAADEHFVRHNGVVAVVADGVGGHAHGGEASQVAVREFLRTYRARPWGSRIPDALYLALKAANHAVCEFAHAQGEAGNCGTTLVAAALHPHSHALYWVSVGDSRLYLLRGQEWAQITADGNYATQHFKRIARGTPPSDALATKLDHRTLTSFLGLRHFCEIDRSIRPFTVEEGDWVVLCTDGIFNSLGTPELVGCLQGDPQKASEALVRSVLAKGLKHQDNCTVAILAYGAEDAEADAPAPADKPPKARGGLKWLPWFGA
jgi:protein phosphatase